MGAIDLETTPLFFAEKKLGLSLYGWQAQVVTWFARAAIERTKGTLSSPNGAGKDDRVISTLALWWVAMHRRGRVVITTKDSRQLDEQTYPSLSKHQGKFEGWKFIERYIETPTGGKIILFTTDESGRAEGWHKEDDLEGPLLIIVNEAKSVPEPIFQAFDRCTYNGLFYASSPGLMHGSFWDSHNKPELGFRRLAVGLKDCPHIPESRVHDVLMKYGPQHPFTRSTLYGEFMLDGAESRFDFEGLEALQRQAEIGHGLAKRGTIQEHNGKFTFVPDDHGWFWMQEAPMPGRSYLVFADPMSGQESSGKRDTHGCGVLRQNYLDEQRSDHPTELVGAIYSESDEFSGSACRWELSVLAERVWLMSGFYGQCTIVPEENNNCGGVLIKHLVDRGCNVWRRTKETHERSGKTIRAYGYQTNSKTKRYWVEELARVIFEQSFVCRFKPAVAQLAAFIQNEDGTCEARTGAFDDFVAGLGIGLTVGAYTLFAPQQVDQFAGLLSGREQEQPRGAWM